MSELDEAPLWRRSRRCDSGACIEVARLGGGFAVRDSKSPEGPRLMFNASAWGSFLAGVQAGEFDSDLL